MLAPRFPTLIVLLCALLAASLAQRAQAKIFADLEVSKGGAPLGTIRIELEYEKTPQTCANFIGLAEGTLPWLDPLTGIVQVNRPFYDGIKFHRLVHDFVIQGGDPLTRDSDPGNDGKGGSGYIFKDEFDATLRHTGRYIVSMSNSGPWSNGSQFFISLQANPGLDDIHTVFGTVVGGTSIVDDFTDDMIHPTDAGSHPLTPICIESVTIVRENATDEAFDASAQGLPKICGVDMTSGLGMRKNGSSYLLDFDLAPRSVYYIYSSPDLETSFAENTKFFTGGETFPGPVSVTSIAAPSGIPFPEYYFLVSKASYPAPVLTPRLIGDGSLRLALEFAAQVDISRPVSPIAPIIDLQFNSQGTGGTYVLRDSVGNPTHVGTVFSVDWDPDGYSAEIFIPFASTWSSVSVNLSFESSISPNGRFSGRIRQTVTGESTPRSAVIRGIFRLTFPP